MVSYKNQTRNLRGTEEELEMARFGGEDPIGFTAVGDQHGGNSGCVSELER